MQKHDEGGAKAVDQLTKDNLPLGSPVVVRKARNGELEALVLVQDEQESTPVGDPRLANTHTLDSASRTATW